MIIFKSKFRTPSSTQRNDTTMNDADLFEDSQLALDIPDSERDSQMSRKVRKMMWPWVKTPFVANNFENRYKAHEKMLQEQQKMIKDQQLLIEDLKYQQSQTVFKEQIALLEQIKQKQEELERMQKAQYNQEKKLLAEMANAKNKEVKFKKNESEKIVETNDNNFDEEEEADQTAITETTFNNNNQTSFTNSSKTPRFLKSMEERAKQREKLRIEREERKRQQENEKLKEMQAKHEEKLRIEEEERRKKNEELKEKRKIEQDLKNKRDMEKRREQELNDKADAYYKKYLMRHYCLNGFRRLMEIREQQTEIAEQHYKLCLYNKSINAWRFIIMEQVRIKNQIADIFYRKYLVRHYFIFGWKNFKMSVRFEEAKASRFYKYNLKMKIFNTIKTYTAKEKLKYKEYDTWIDNYSDEKIKIKYFKKWKEFPIEMKKLEEREKRLNEMRKRVQQIIPDFNGNSSISESTTLSFT